MKIDLLGFNEKIVEDLLINKEASEYHGCSYRFNNRKIIQRKAKVTPTKNGQFVTLWKRHNDGVTCPLSFEDDFDYVVIVCVSKALVGRFLFSKETLQIQGYISSFKKGGKRGFRVYPDWDIPITKQALKTQSWQKKYFKRTAQLSSCELF